MTTNRQIGSRKVGHILHPDTGAALCDAPLKGEGDTGRPVCRPCYDRFMGHYDAMRRNFLAHKAGARALAEALEKQGQIALDATGLHDLIDEDGDGDWQAVWEAVAALGKDRGE